MKNTRKLIGCGALLSLMGCSDFLFTSSRDSEPGTLNYEAYRRDGLGREVRLTFTSTIEEHPVLATDGKIYYSGHSQPPDATGSREVFVLDPDTGTSTRVTTSGSGIESNSHPFLAPDEQSLFVTSHKSDHTSIIRRVFLDGSTPTVVVDHGAEVGHSPAASTPAGDRIYFSSNRNGNFDIYWSDFDGTTGGNLTQAHGGQDVYESGPALDAAGARIAYSRETSPCTTQVYVMDYDGSDPRQVTSSNDPGFKWPFAWDGDDILYVSGETGDNRIYSISADGSGKTQVVDSGGEDQHLLADSLCGVPRSDLELEAVPRIGPPGTTVAFELGTGGESFARYNWSFGDGTADQTTVPTTSHQYRSPGTYAVAVTTEDNCTPPNKRTADLPVVQILRGDEGEGPVAFGQLAQEAVDAMPREDRPEVVEGGVVFSESADLGRFARTFVGIVRELGRTTLPGQDSVDLEARVRLAADSVLLRVVAGRDGREGAGEEAPAGEDGVSVRGVTEERPAVILIVAAGHGGAGATRCAPGGAGGSAEALSLSPGGALLTIGGDAGPAGLVPCGTTDIRPDAGPGGDGGSARAHTRDCTAPLVYAEGGDGGNGVILKDFDNPATFGDGGDGGRGGNAVADCDPEAGEGPCYAAALAGNGGHGASGENRIEGDGRPGGRGGAGGSAEATSCCGTREGRRDGNAAAVAGSGGQGGHGGNSLSDGGDGGDGRDGGGATATVRPGLLDSEARAVAGNGGSGGSGGNSLGGAGAAVGGDGGAAGAAGAAGATNECEQGSQRERDGVGGQEGKNGQPRPR